MTKSTQLLRQVEILLVEDNVADLLLMMKFFKESSVENRVNVVRDGNAAMDYLIRVNGFEAAVKPDLILLDLSLPGKDGREVLREVKTNPALSHIPLVVMTGSSHPEEIIKAYADKANFFMVKPSDLDQFKASMKYLEMVWMKKCPGQPKAVATVQTALKKTPLKEKENQPLLPMVKTKNAVYVLMVEENMGDVSWMREALNIHHRFIELIMVKNRDQMMDYLGVTHGYEESQLPDVILLDLSAPQTSDLEFLSLIRLNSALENIPVVILTHPKSEVDIRRTHDHPSHFCVKKTKQPDELFGAIHHIVTMASKRFSNELI